MCCPLFSLPLLIADSVQPILCFHLARYQRSLSHSPIENKLKKRDSGNLTLHPYWLKNDGKNELDNIWTHYFESKDVIVQQLIEKIIKIEKKFLVIFGPQGPPLGVPIFCHRVGISKICLMVYVSLVSGSIPPSFIRIGVIQRSQST